MVHDAKCFSLYIYSYLHLQQFDIFSISSLWSMDRISIDYRNGTVGLIEGGPDPDFDPH